MIELVLPCSLGGRAPLVGRDIRLLAILLLLPLCLGMAGGCDSGTELVEPHAEIHVRGEVTDANERPLANSHVRVIAYDKCGPTLGTLEQTATRADGTFFVRLLTTIGSDVCVTVIATPPANRSELQRDSVTGVAATFWYRPPWDSVFVSVVLGTH
jgi:hypothetical protein